VAAPPVWAAFLYARLRYGLNFWNASPARALAKSATPILLIHGLSDTKTPPEHSRILASVNPGATTLWLVPGAEHTAAFGIAASEYEARVLGFFAVYQNLPAGIQSREK
jgi:uncharacterized protein